MNAFTQTSAVEQKGLALLLPFLEARAFNGQIVNLRKGTLAQTLQASFGDVMMNTDPDPDTVVAVEIKIEQRWTGNLFLETWSNRNLDDKASHAARGCSPGWVISTRADLLAFYFLDTDDLVAVPTFRLKRWAFGSGPDGGLYAFPEKQQRRYQQPNDSWGRVVPIDVIAQEVGAKRMNVRQMSLWDGGMVQ
jgi:hypothetical protein